MMILMFIFGVMITLFALYVITHCKGAQPTSNVHFYVARDKDKILWLYIGKPIRDKEYGTFVSNEHGSVVAHGSCFENLGLNLNNYKDLKWEDEPVEVFLNIEK